MKTTTLKSYCLLNGKLIYIKNFMKISMIIFIIYGCSEIRDWKLARNTDTIEEYQNYMNNYPDGKHFSDAQEAIARIDSSNWKQATEINSIKAYIAYLDSNKDGEYRKDAQKAIIKIKEKKLWTNTLKLDTKKAYENFLSEYDSGDFKLFAKAHIAEKMLESGASKNSYSDYISTFKELFSEYPKEPYSKKADFLMGVLEKLVKKGGHDVLILPGEITECGSDTDPVRIEYQIRSGNSVITLVHYSENAKWLLYGPGILKKGQKGNLYGYLRDNVPIIFGYKVLGFWSEH